MSTTTTIYPDQEQQQSPFAGTSFNPDLTPEQAEYFRRNDPGPIRQPRGFFARHREPDDSIWPIEIGPSLIRRNLRLAKPFLPRSLNVGIPGLMFHMHWDGSRAGQKNRLGFLGYAITFSHTFGVAHYFRRSKATRIVKRAIKAAPPEKLEKYNPKFSTTGDLGVPGFRKAAAGLAANPYRIHGLKAEYAGQLYRATGQFVPMDPQGNNWNKDSALMNGFGVPKPSIFGNFNFGGSGEVAEGWNQYLALGLPQLDQPPYGGYGFGPGMNNMGMFGGQQGYGSGWNFDPVYGWGPPAVLPGQAANSRRRAPVSAGTDPLFDPGLSGESQSRFSREQVAQIREILQELSLERPLTLF